ncbi:MAG: ATP synthase F1 subunit gamma [Oscillospiraceae bacterium]|nr:ATP synthase F1 subunit gamma [Oscillospiraceae bacterium]
MASGNMKIIKRRIKSVGSTMQITKAMELVASSKLRRAKKKAIDARPYFKEQVRMLSQIAESSNIETKFTKKPRLANPENKRSLYIVVAGDRGLAGGYNSGIFKLAAADYGDSRPKMITIGKKAVEYYEKRGYEIASKHIGLAENVKSGHCADIANVAMKLFLDGEVDEVKLFYTRFVSSMTQTPAVMTLLPLPTDSEQIGTPMAEVGTEQTQGEEIKAKLRTEVAYDPSPEAVFNRIVPCFLLSILQCAITESYASEQCARRIAMESASDNAEEMIENLSLLYNRARQEKITNEINEIVGGANAL